MHAISPAARKVALYHFPIGPDSGQLASHKA